MLTAPDQLLRSQADGRTLAEVAGQIERDRSLDDHRRHAWRGAVRTICSILGRAPEAVPATLADVDRLLRTIPQVAHGRSRKTIANTRSRLKRALLHCAGAPKLPPHGTPLAPAWNTLYERLPDARLRNGLSRFLRLASYRGIAPSEVSDAVLGEIVRDVAQVNWGRDARPFWRRTALLWNEACTRVKGWPQVPLTPPPEPERRPHLPFAAFPESFVNEVNTYLQWAAGNDALAADAPDHPLKPSTLRLRAEQLRIAASTLARALGGTTQITGLGELVKPENARRILRAYAPADASEEPSAFVRGLAITLQSVARHWVKAPESDLVELARFKRKLGSAPSGLTAKNQDLIRKFNDPALLRALLELPDALLAELSTRRVSPERRLQKVRTALAIELLLAVPLRMHNLAALRLDQQLQWPSGRSGPVYIVIRNHESKNAQPLEYELPGKSRELLDHYLERYHVHVGNGAVPWLFAHRDGSPVAMGTLRDGIVKALRRGLNIHMTPHQFRHLCAAIMLGERPGALGDVRGMLGHKSLKTTIGFYAGLRTREAGLEYDRILQKKRRGDEEK